MNLEIMTRKLFQNHDYRNRRCYGHVSEHLRWIATQTENNVFLYYLTRTVNQSDGERKPSVVKLKTQGEASTASVCVCVCACVWIMGGVCYEYMKLRGRRRSGGSETPKVWSGKVQQLVPQAETSPLVVQRGQSEGRTTQQDRNKINSNAVEKDLSPIIKRRPPVSFNQTLWSSKQFVGALGAY